MGNKRRKYTLILYIKNLYKINYTNNKKKNLQVTILSTNVLFENQKTLVKRAVNYRQAWHNSSLRFLNENDVVMNSYHY